MAGNVLLGIVAVALGLGLIGANGRLARDTFRWRPGSRGDLLDKHLAEASSHMFRWFYTERGRRNFHRTLYVACGVGFVWVGGSLLAQAL